MNPAYLIKKPSDRDIHTPFANPARCITVKNNGLFAKGSLALPNVLISSFF
jgi:hypothetical protein